MPIARATSRAVTALGEEPALRSTGFPNWINQIGFWDSFSRVGRCFANRTLRESTYRLKTAALGVHLFCRLFLGRPVEKHILSTDCADPHPRWSSVYWLAGGGALALAVHPVDKDVRVGDLHSP